MNKGVVFLFCFFIFSVEFYVEAQSISIIPTPQKVIYKNFNIEIKSDWNLFVDKDDEEIFSVAKYLTEELLNRFDLVMGIQKVPSAQMEKRIVLRLGDEQFEELGEQGYILEVFEKHILITGTKPVGIFYGIQTLLQLSKNDNGKIIIPAVKIIDFPKTKFRGVHILDVDLNRIKKQLDLVAKLKMNIVLLGSQKYFQLNNGNNRQRFEEIFSYARERFIEPIPDLGTFGAGEPVLSKDPYAAEGICVENEHFKFVNDEAIPLNPTKHTLVNVIRSEDSNIIVKNLGETKTYEEDLDYKVIEGSISFPYSLDNRPTKIIRNPSGDIKNGEEVLITYDYVENKCASWASWSIPYCPSSERSYKILYDTIEDVIQSLTPHYINIGHDEIRGLNRDSRCKKRNLTNAELLAEEINKLNDFVKSIDPNIRLLMWDDMVTPWHNGGNENYQVQFGGVLGKTSDAIDLIPNDIILIIWWYDSSDWLYKMKNSPNFFELKGFDYLVASWKDKKNIKNWIELIQNKNKCLGIIATNWEGWDKNIEGIRYTAEMGWH